MRARPSPRRRGGCGGAPRGPRPGPAASGGRRVRTAAGALLAAFLVSGGGAATAQDSPALTLGGSVYAQEYGAWSGEGSALRASYGSTTTLGLELRARGSRARTEASIETAVLTGAAARDAWARAASGGARSDELLLPAARSAGSDGLVAARVRTLYSKLELGAASLAVGRQVLNYGRGALWSPVDIFTELDLTGISPVRRGTDSLRLGAALGETGSAEAVAAPRASPRDGRYAIRASGLLGGVDAGAVAARDGTRRTWTLGGDFKADLDAGVYGEAAYDLRDGGGSGGLRAAGGADWSFGGFVVAVEYYYNGGGAAADPLFPDSHNAYASLTWGPTELASISLLAIVDPSSGAGRALLRAVLSAAQNAVLGAYLQVVGSPGTGSGGQAGITLEVRF